MFPQDRSTLRVHSLKMKVFETELALIIARLSETATSNALRDQLSRLTHAFALLQQIDEEVRTALDYQESPDV